MTKILTFGVFDYFHLGHLRLFKQCKEQGDYLIVAVQNGEYIAKYKPGTKTIYTTDERIEILESLKIVDEVVTYNSVDAKTLERIDFDILALGEDHTSERFLTAEKWCDIHGKKTIRLKRTPGICSSDIKNRLISLQ